MTCPLVQWRPVVKGPTKAFPMNRPSTSMYGILSPSGIATGNETCAGEPPRWRSHPSHSSRGLARHERHPRIFPAPDDDPERIAVTTSRRIEYSFAVGVLRSFQDRRVPILFRGYRALRAQSPAAVAYDGFAILKRWFDPRCSSSLAMSNRILSLAHLSIRDTARIICKACWSQKDLPSTPQDWISVPR